MEIRNLFRQSSFHCSSDRPVTGLQHFVCERGVVGWEKNLHPQGRRPCPNMKAVIHSGSDLTLVKLEIFTGAV